MVEVAFPPFDTLRSHTVVLPLDDIDTDQILPARFMATTDRAGLGQVLFHDWRYDAAGDLISDQVLNRSDPATHRILVTGRNFGSGSSREHAPWALVDFGFRAIIALSIADIFLGNAVQNGLLPICVPDDVHRAITAAPGQMMIDLNQQILTMEDIDLTWQFVIEPFARTCLLEGHDVLGWLVDRLPEIEAHESKTVQA